MTRTEERGRAILEIFAEAQGIAREAVDDTHARLRAWRLERWRENSANRRAAKQAARVKPAARGGLPEPTKEQKSERRRAARHAIKAEIAALRAARKAAA
jgi:hypothetical protein